MSETDLSRAIRKALTLKGCKLIRVQSGTVPLAYGGKTRFVHLAPKGTPDWLVIREGPVYTWLEIKLEGKKLNSAQQAWHQWGVTMGLRVAIVSSVDEAIFAVFAPRLESTSLTLRRSSVGPELPKKPKGRRVGDPVLVAKRAG